MNGDGTRHDAKIRSCCSALGTRTSFVQLFSGRALTHLKTAPKHVANCQESNARDSPTLIPPAASDRDHRRVLSVGTSKSISLRPRNTHDRGKSRTLVAVNERMVARYAESVGGRKSGEDSPLGKMVERPAQGRFEQTESANSVPHRRGPAIGMKIKNDGRVEPLRLVLPPGLVGVGVFTERTASDLHPLEGWGRYGLSLSARGPDSTTKKDGRLPQAETCKQSLAGSARRELPIS